MVHIIHLKPSDIDFFCAPDEAVLTAIRRQNIAGVDVGCRGGGCGVCRVLVLSGAYHTGRQSRAQVTVVEEAAGIALACRLYPQGDLVIEALGPKIVQQVGNNIIGR